MSMNLANGTIKNIFVSDKNNNTVATRIVPIIIYFLHRTGHMRFAGLTLGWLLLAWVLSTYRSACVYLTKKEEKEKRERKGNGFGQRLCGTGKHLCSFF